MTITGQNFVASERRTGNETFKARDAASGKEFGEAFATAGAGDVSDACKAAAEAQPVFAALPLAERARFLRLIADRIDSLGDILTRRAMRETGLPEARLNGERGRTVGQLRLFADEVEHGGWQGLRIDHADPGRTPPKPDLRMRKIPLGPVAVFGASNFPLAFSVAGGDTASAFAAGCCVVVKGHPAHPGTSELVGGAICDAISEMNLPAGTFSLLNGVSNDLGEALVKDPRIAAVGFTGSRAGGIALMRHAASRPVPIPVYAEMSSVNPVILLPSRLDEAAEELGAAYVNSLTLGAGQFCTNPGIVLAIGSEAFDRFTQAAAQALSGIGAQTMLTGAISESFANGSARLANIDGVELVGMGTEGSSMCGRAQIYSTDAETFMGDARLADEVFGPASLMVACDSLGQLRAVLEGLEGQLTVSLHLDERDRDAAATLVPTLESLAGRIIANGWPTGVDVTHAMVHGGPFPATSDGRSTSVGTLAIDRFLRPVSYQDMPQELLPAVLSDGVHGVPRRIDGRFEVR